MNNAKIICVIGQTGAGKTTLLNTLLNYCLGVQITDSVRYRLIVEEGLQEKKGSSVTNDVTMYHIEGTPRNPPHIVVDTPGFGDTRGLG
jgi:putative ribosome biogenesis GTPase RsgA